MTPPSAMVVSAPRARDDDLPPCYDGCRPPCGRGHNSYPPCSYCGKQNHLANKYWKQFGKPPTVQEVFTPSATLSLASPGTPTPHYHVTLTSDEYDALRHSRDTDASSSISCSSLFAPSTLGTSMHLTSSSPPWIIHSQASSHMIGTSSLLSSYRPTPSHPLVTIDKGRPCLVQGCDTTRVTNSLSLHQILYVPHFPMNLLSISAITRALPYTITLFLSHYVFQDLYIRGRIGLDCENG